MNKKGFTLIELLAVIAILAILVIIALPNVLSMYKQTKQNSFTTEVKNMYKTAQHQWMQDSFVEPTEREYTKCEGCQANKELKISGGEDLSYYVKMDQNGKVKEMYVTNGVYQFEYSGDLLETYINDVEVVEDLEDNEIITIVPEGVKKNNVLINGGTTVLSGLTEQEKAALSLTLTYDYNWNVATTLTIKLNNSSTIANLNTVRYVINKAKQNSTSDDWGEYSYVDTINSNNKTNNFTETVVTDGDYYGFKFTVDAYVNDEKILTKEVVRYWCFVAGTKVLTENGYKNIEDIKIGEKVYSYNLDTNILELKEVLNTITSSTKETIKVTMGSETVEMSDRHELYIIDRGWVRAYDLKAGDQLLDSNSKIITIDKVERIVYSEAIPTYNLTVEGNHNYFVTNIQVLVHNAASPESK